MVERIEMVLLTERNVYFRFKTSIFEHFGNIFLVYICVIGMGKDFFLQAQAQRVGEYIKIEVDTLSNKVF